MSFDHLGLRANLLSAIAQEGYTEPTPIQEKTIPLILEGKDVLGGAQTGTGKTAAFALPILHKLVEADLVDRRPRALIMTPTRELAVQVAESVKTYAKDTNMRTTVVYGGVLLEPQIDRLGGGIDILIATPGRLYDLYGQGAVDLSRIEVLVLDEADRMLDMGFLPDIKKIIELIPEQRQNLLFSATYSDEIKKLADGFLKNPILVEVARTGETAEGIEQVVYFVSKQQKCALLAHLIKRGNWHQVLVFTKTKIGADRLTGQLVREGIAAKAIHGDKTQESRMYALDRFKNGKIRVLVATDVASRGLDIDRLPHVVNYDLPNMDENYVHRIGRTGRAGEEGMAVSLVCKEERIMLKGIEKLLGYSIPVEIVADFKMQKEQSGQSRHGGGGWQGNRGRGGAPRNHPGSLRKGRGPHERKARR